MRKVQDDVYGEVVIDNDLLEDLIESQAIQRLRKVSQAGASSLVRSGRDVTRYEHSVGVMTLTGILGGSINEQAAGFLQDVSHTAFSHTIDYVFDNRREEFHERIFERVVEASDIPAILERYGLKWHDLFTPTNLRRVDVPSPLLCADRIDYTLRDLSRFGYISTTEARAMLSALAFKEETIAFTDAKNARRFAECYHYLVNDIFMNPLELYAHAEMARIIREAIRLGVVTEDDLLGTDDVILTKLESDIANGLGKALTELKEVRSVVVNGPSGYHVYGKGRIIDPPVLQDGKIAALSETESEILSWWDRVKDVSANGIYVRAGNPHTLKAR
jgi:HD superfamily phosphohydrolase